MKHLLLVGDLGVGTNFVKNICFTDLSYTAPFNLRYLESIYKSNIADLSKFWLVREYNTRKWQTKWQCDLSDNINLDTVEKFLTIPKTIFINHSSFYSTCDREMLLKLSNLAHVVLLIPNSLQGLQWQVRAYVTKKGIENLHDFTFLEEKEKHKKAFIELHGKDAYNKINVLNMFEICQKRLDDMKQFFELNGLSILYTEDLYKNCFDNFVQNLQLLAPINLNIDKAQLLYENWLSMHWPFEETNNWEYTYEKIH